MINKFFLKSVSIFFGILAITIGVLAIAGFYDTYKESEESASVLESKE